MVTRDVWAFVCDMYSASVFISKLLKTENNHQYNLSLTLQTPNARFNINSRSCDDGLVMFLPVCPSHSSQIRSTNVGMCWFLKGIMQYCNRGINKS